MVPNRVPRANCLAWGGSRGAFVWGVGAILLWLLPLNVLAAEDTINNQPNQGVINHFSSLLATLHLWHVLPYHQVVDVLMIVMLIKLMYHMTYKYSRNIPESGLLTIIGILMGLSIMAYFPQDETIFNPDTFFLLLLPLIIIDAGYFLPVKSIVENCGGVMMFAFIGTLFNIICLSLITYGYGLYSEKLNLPNLQAEYYKELTILRSFMFGSVISAVDPVAVVAVFESIHVNEQLFALVFGESLFNDGVVIVVYKVFEYASKQEKSVNELKNVPSFVGAAILKFVLSCVLGVMIGLVFGIFGIFLSKYTYHVQFIEPVAMIIIMYASYVFAETFQLSAIFACVMTAALMKAFIPENISDSSNTALRYIIKITSQMSEGGIFVFIGITNVIEYRKDRFDIYFCLLIFFSSLVVRFIGVILISGFMNFLFLETKKEKIDYKEQFIIAYSGLRGAISLTLSTLMVKEAFDGEELGHVLSNATSFLVLATIFLQGTTVQCCIKCMKVKKVKEDKTPVLSTLNDQLIEMTTDLFRKISHTSPNSQVIHAWSGLRRRLEKKFANKPADIKRQKYLRIIKKSTGGEGNEGDLGEAALQDAINDKAEALLRRTRSFPAAIEPSEFVANETRVPRNNEDSPVSRSSIQILRGGNNFSRRFKGVLSDDKSDEGDDGLPNDPKNTTEGQ